ncbi:MAG: hypothetical protein ACREB0_04500 [Sphingopyxis sp.]
MRARRSRFRGRPPGRRLSRRAIQIVAKSILRPPREARIAGERWTAARINRLLYKRWGLKWSTRYAIRRLRAAGVRVRLIRAREPRLTRAALEQLKRTLRRPPRGAGIAAEQWSRARVAELIERRFGKQFTTAHAGRLARRLRGRSLGASRDRRLTAEQGRALRAALKARAPGHPKVKPSWSRLQIAALIEAQWGVRYHVQSIPGVLKRWRIAVALSPAVRERARPTQEQLRQLSAALSLPPIAAGICAARWEQRYIAQYLCDRFELRVPHKGLYRRLMNWGLTVPARASAGGTCALNAEQRLTLTAALTMPPEACGHPQARWSRALVAQVIFDRFHIHYACGSIPHVLRRAGLRLRATPKATRLAISPAALEAGAIAPPPAVERRVPPASPPHPARADF